MLGFLAAATEGIRLGVGVANPYTRNPALLAMASATLDRISGGRFLLGLGRSDRSVIQGRMGMPYRSPLATLEEAATIIRDLLAGERVTSTEGRFRLRNAHLETRPVQQRPPIYLAAIGPKALRLAGGRRRWRPTQHLHSSGLREVCGGGGAEVRQGSGPRPRLR